MSEKKIISLLLFSLLPLHLVYPTPPVYLSLKPQNVNNARRSVATQQYVHKNNVAYSYGMVSALFEYNKTFNTHNLTHHFFQDALQKTACNEHALIISGSAVTQRGAQDLLADYFYLPPDFQSKVTFKPTIQNSIVDFNWYLGLDQLHPGLYLSLYAPLVHTKSCMNLQETILSKSSTSFRAGYFSPQPLVPGVLAQSFESFAQGDIINDVQQTLADIPTTIALQSLRNAQIKKESLQLTRLADIRAIIGWNILNNPSNLWRIGIYSSMSAPTGNRLSGNALLEPLVGNGHHVELGCGVNGFYTVWNNIEKDYNLNLSGDITVSHLFGAHQKRTFDLKNKPLSRYMTAIKFKDTIANNLQGAGVTPIAQFDNQIAPVANLSTLYVKSSATIQTDMVALLSFSMPHWSFDIGYNLWARCAEDIHLDDNAYALLNMQKWGLKGDAQLFGFIPNTGAGTLAANTPVALSTSQHNATIYSGLNLLNNSNASIDSPALATADTTNRPLQNQLNSSTNPINTSIQPTFFTPSDFETCGITTAGITSAIFGNIQYHWQDNSTWQPSLGIGFKVEFAHSRKKPYADTTHALCAASTWSIWLKSSIAFN